VPKDKVFIMGAGKLGTALYCALSACEAEVHIYDTAPDKKNHFKNFHPQISQPLFNNVAFIVIAAPDDRIGDCVDQLLKFQLQNKVVAHTSGTQSSAILHPLKKMGALTASFHPIQTFNGKEDSPALWETIYCSLEGEAQAIGLLEILLKKIGAKTLRVSAADKELLHIAAVFSSNYLVSLFTIVQKITQNIEANIDAAELFKPLVEQLIDNYKNKPFNKILTGPLQRGDVETIKKHLSRMESFAEKDILNLYKSLAKPLLEDRQFEIHKRDELKALINK
jgi:predicted short-subunit dehydrogenase-like oxidoreductase (DUF2520 family)